MNNAGKPPYRTITLRGGVEDGLVMGLWDPSVTEVISAPLPGTNHRVVYVPSADDPGVWDVRKPSAAA